MNNNNILTKTPDTIETRNFFNKRMKIFYIIFLLCTTSCSTTNYSDIKSIPKISNSNHASCGIGW